MRPALPRPRAAGFTLVEVVIVIAIIGILSAIAYPSYVNSIMRSNRASARACVVNFATHMERFYTTNMRYDKTTPAAVAIVLPQLECATANDTGKHYTYQFATGQPTQNTYTLEAVPKGVQATRDTACATLTLTHTGVRGKTGSAGTVDECW